MKIIGTETLVQTDFVNFNATEFKDNNGEKKFWCWAQRPRGTKAVMIVAHVDLGFKEFRTTTPAGYNKDIRIVITKEFRVPLGNYEFGFPAGLVDKDESMVDAARRELLEETGLTLTEVIRQSPCVYNSAGLTDESISIIFVKAEGDISQEGLEASEDIETKLYTKEEVAELLADESKMIAAKAWVILDNFVNGSPFK